MNGKGVRGAAVLIGTMLVTYACNVEININAEPDNPSVPVAPAAPEAPAAPQTPAVPESPPAPDAVEAPAAPRVETRVAPLPPLRIEPTEPGLGRSGVISDALWREERAVVEPPTIAQDLRAGPTFTPFTQAPAILNRNQIVEAMQSAYPPLLRDAGIGGTTRIYFFITEVGLVEDIRIRETSGHEALDDAALSVAALYRFAPALKGDETVPVWVAFPITFRNQ